MNATYSVYTINCHGTPPNYPYPFSNSPIHILATSWKDALSGGEGPSSWLTTNAACPMAQRYWRGEGIAGKERVFEAAGII